MPVQPNNITRKGAHKAVAAIKWDKIMKFVGCVCNIGN